VTIERREHPRQPLSQEVHCYIDGVRVDSRTLDISASGAFVRMSRSRAVSPGALVGLVFLRHPQVLQTTFLFGRVVRIQPEPIEGIALAWEKAVTVAPPEDLARFLETVFDIQSPTIRQEPSGPRGTARSVFSFGTISTRVLARAPWAGETPAPMPAPMSTPSPSPAPASAQPPSAGRARPHPTPSQFRPAPPRSPALEVEIADPFDAAALGAQGLAVSSEDFDALELKVIALERDGTPSREPREPPAPEARVAKRESGQISAMVAREDVPVSLPGVLSLGDDALPVTLRLLCDARVFVRTPFVPMNRQADLTLRFDIPARRGSTPVQCRCRLQEARAEDDEPGPGLFLHILSMDEGGSPGIVTRYVKFVQFTDLART
jgi:hypothetical protein